MKVLDIGLKRPAIIPSTIVMMMVFIMMKILEYMRVMKDVDIGLLRPFTLIIATMEFIIVIIEVVTMVDVDKGIKIPSSLPLNI